MKNVKITFQTWKRLMALKGKKYPEETFDSIIGRGLTALETAQEVE